VVVLPVAVLGTYAGDGGVAFEDTLEFCRKTGRRTGLARSLLDDSLAISSELGMRPVMERVRARHEMPGAQWPADRP
jgi:hypothetical protein